MERNTLAVRPVDMFLCEGREERTGSEGTEGTEVGQWTHDWTVHNAGTTLSVCKACFLVAPGFFPARSQQKPSSNKEEEPVLQDGIISSLLSTQSDMSACKYYNRSQNNTGHPFMCVCARRARRQDVKHGDPWSQCPVTEDSKDIRRLMSNKLLLFGMFTHVLRKDLHAHKHIYDIFIRWSTAN